MTTERYRTSEGETPSDTSDRVWLARAVRLASDSVDRGGGPFGALIVRDGHILASGSNRVTESLDPTAHAEVIAIREACQSLGDFRLDGCALVASCEPCPMCLATALWARVDRVVYAADRHDAAHAGFDDLAFYEMFSVPRKDWKVSVRQLSVDHQTAPFGSWAAKPDRVKY